MKVRSIILSITAAALLAAPTAVLAQGGPGGGGPGGGGWGGNQGFGAAGGPGNGMLRMLENRLNHFAERIGLDETQVAQIEAILADHHATVDPYVEELQALRQEWHDNHTPGDFNDAAFRTFLETEAPLDIEIKVASASAFAKIWNEVLTTEQQEQVQSMRGRSGAGLKRGGGRRVK